MDGCIDDEQMTWIHGMDEWMKEIKYEWRDDGWDGWVNKRMHRWCIEFMDIQIGQMDGWMKYEWRDGWDGCLDERNKV